MDRLRRGVADLRTLRKGGHSDGKPAARHGCPTRNFYTSAVFYEGFETVETVEAADPPTPTAGEEGVGEVPGELEGCRDRDGSVGQMCSCDPGPYSSNHAPSQFDGTANTAVTNLRGSGPLGPANSQRWRASSEASVAGRGATEAPRSQYGEAGRTPDCTPPQTPTSFGAGRIKENNALAPPQTPRDPPVFGPGLTVPMMEEEGRGVLWGFDDELGEWEQADGVWCPETDSKWG